MAKRFVATKKIVLYDETAKVYAGLVDGKITAEEVIEQAVVFDERDSIQLKQRFYNTVTGLNFSIIAEDI